MILDTSALSKEDGIYFTSDITQSRVIPATAKKFEEYSFLEIFLPPSHL